MRLSLRQVAWTYFNDMSHGEFGVKQETKIPYFLCELNAASAKRDGG